MSRHAPACSPQEKAPGPADLQCPVIGRHEFVRVEGLVEGLPWR